ncbi:MAG: thioredoxin [Comamonadaceae bacterium]|nr:MAG: thioredoxin [Comamonadaceae bacterium]
MSIVNPRGESTTPGWVVCLCADWCVLCRDYSIALKAVAARHPQWRFAWIDIEDHAALVGDLDIETFPTLLIADGAGVRFLGPLTPQAENLSRLLTSDLKVQATSAADAALIEVLLQRLPSMPELWLAM